MSDKDSTDASDRVKEARRREKERQRAAALHKEKRSEVVVNSVGLLIVAGVVILILLTVIPSIRADRAESDMREQRRVEWLSTSTTAAPLSTFCTGLTEEQCVDKVSSIADEFETNLDDLERLVHDR